MDSKSVSKEIRGVIWPQLKSMGFASFTSRTARRYGLDRIDVVNFQSYNSYNAGILGVTTFSFSVNLGCFLQYVPSRWPPTAKEGRLLPAESECQFRGRLPRTISQQSNKHKDIWSVDQMGRNLAWCIKDVEQQIPGALQWFRRLDSKDEVLRILQEEPEDMSHLWGFGHNPSPVRSYLAGYVALHLGREELARTRLQEAVNSKCFSHLFSDLEGAARRAL